MHTHEYFEIFAMRINAYNNFVLFYVVRSLHFLRLYRIMLISNERSKQRTIARCEASQNDCNRKRRTKMQNDDITKKLASMQFKRAHVSKLTYSEALARTLRINAMLSHASNERANVSKKLASTNASNTKAFASLTQRKRKISDAQKALRRKLRKTHEKFTFSIASCNRACCKNKANSDAQKASNYEAIATKAISEFEKFDVAKAFENELR